ncbi:MAG: S1/P1 nuclease [Cyclobacteriaceae bacterium]|nr:S1/P1 nuclease [Cyclobacteriaceae bacterium]
MKKKLLVLGMLCFAMVQAFGWGATGHRATGLIAEQYLNAKAKKKIAMILEQESIAMVSNWMDEIRSDSTYNYATDWHWSTIPDGKKYEDVESIANPDGRLIMMIEKVTKELKSGKLTAKQEKEFLKMLIHMIGDVHQPLHVGKPGDKGGNDVKLKWFRNDSNLHRVWDSEMIDDSKLSYTELANGIVKPDALVVKKWQATTVRDWALESMGYRPQVYDIGNGNLSYQYGFKYFGIAKMRILQAGIRMAGVLNDIYGK